MPLPFNILENITVKIEASTIKAWLLTQLREQGYEAREEDIQFDLKTVYHGYGPNEHNSQVFAGVTAKVKRKD